jgi:hypothetical protein
MRKQSSGAKMKHASAASARIKRSEENAAGHLRGALHLIEKNKGKPSAELLESIKGLVRNAVEVLKEPDPLKQQIAFVLLAIRESTHVSHHTSEAGRTVTKVTIIDQILYAWAIGEIHKIAGA